MKTIYIIGAGPAGVSAAINLVRLNYKVVVIYKQSDNFTSNDLISNYYGFANPISTTKLFETGILQAKNLGVTFVNDTLLDVKRQDDGYLLVTLDNQFLAKQLIIATGKIRAGLKVSGFSDFRGKGIYLCANCDGFFFKNKKVAIIGHGEYLKSELKTLSGFTDDIIIFTTDKDFSSNKYQIISEPVIKFSGDYRLRSITTTSNEYQVTGAFIAMGYPGSLELASKLGIITEKNSILVDSSYQTNLDNVYAVGDVIGGKMQVAKAVYDGLMVADMIYLKDKS